MNDENYVVIQGFMINELKLKGNELIIYAVIYGFSQTSGQKFTGSISYLMKWISGSKQTVINCLNSLVEKKLIDKEEEYINNIKYCSYRVVKKLDQWSKFYIEGGQKIRPNNIYNINKKNKEKENIINFYNNNFGLITPHIAENIFSYLDDGLEEKLIIKSMEEAVNNNARRWNYVKAILDDCLNNNIHTLDQYLIKQKEFKNKKTNKTTTTKKEVTYNTDFSEYDKYVKRD